MAHFVGHRRDDWLGWKKDRWADPTQVRLDTADSLINLMIVLTTRHHPLIQLDNAQL